MSTAPEIVTTGGAHDFFPSPRWTVFRFLERMRAKQRLGPFLGRVLEPCAGDGAIIRAASEYIATLHMSGELFWIANELREEALPGLTATLEDVFARGLTIGHLGGCGDFLRTDPRGCDVHATLTNPPFSLAMEFILRARTCSDVVAMLLRVGFLSSEERSVYFADPNNRPDVYVLPNRPSFFVLGEDGKPQTDLHDYAWMVWGQRGPNEPSTWEVLDCTPLDERKRDSAGVRFVDAQLGLFAEGA